MSTFVPCWFLYEARMALPAFSRMSGSWASISSIFAWLSLICCWSFWTLAVASSYAAAEDSTCFWVSVSLASVSWVTAWAATGESAVPANANESAAPTTRARCVSVLAPCMNHPRQSVS